MPKNGQWEDLDLPSPPDLDKDSNQTLKRNDPVLKYLLQVTYLNRKDTKDVIEKVNELSDSFKGVAESCPVRTGKLKQLEENISKNTDQLDDMEKEESTIQSLWEKFGSQLKITATILLILMTSMNIIKNIKDIF